MTDHLSWETLNDLVDGVLSPGTAAAAESHTRECAACAATLAELRSTVADVKTLPQELSPPDDLWTDVRATIEAGKVAHLPLGSARSASRGYWVTPGRLAAAAVVLVAATASLTVVAMRSRAPIAVSDGGSTTTVLASWQSSERAFQASVVELRTQLEALHDHLSPETVPGVEGAAVLARAPEVAASTGSACHAEHDAVSGVLGAMAVPAAQARGALRLSLGRASSTADVERAARALVAAVAALRGS